MAQLIAQQQAEIERLRAALNGKQAASARPFEEGLGMDLDEDHRMFSPHADSSAGFEKLGASEGSRLHTRTV